MGLFNLQPTSLAEWHSLVCEAEQCAGHSLEEGVQSYLIITLDSFLTNEQFNSNVLALDLLRCLESASKENCHQLRNVGDRCLLLAGLFPESAYSKNVTPTYFVRLGKQAYGFIATRYANKKFDSELFTNLNHYFLSLTDVLNAMRSLTVKKLQ